MVAIRRIRLDLLSDADRRSLTQRSAIPDPDLFAAASAIVAGVARDGDAALDRYAEQFGGGREGAGTLVPPSAIEDALSSLSQDVKNALETSIAHVTAVHRRQVPTNDSVTPIAGVTVERIWSPLASVGVYVPGGRARYPSSMIMGVVPARLAGVDRVAVATPASPDGTVHPVVLGTAALLGIEEVHAMGGAQAIAALAFGTERIQAVDKIVGPGGPWVTAAKLAVLGRCGIDLPAGPSEAAIVADATADVAVVAADLMCQAEHGDESAVALIVEDDAFADRVLAEVERVLPRLERSHTIGRALSNHGMIVVAESIARGLAFANEWAPEHLSIHTADARSDAAEVPNAGSVFVGHWTPEAAGDYATGANHILPTGGMARAYGPLGVEDFGSWRQVQELDASGLLSLSRTITTLAEAEGLTAHAYSVAIRMEASR